MHGLVAEDVLELLADPRHPVLAMERENHHETAVEEDPFHNHVKPDEVLQELLLPLDRVRREVRVQD